MLPNASSLTWIENGERLLFSEIKQGMHMGVVTTDPGRNQVREVYDPPGERGMAHHSYLSPDGHWVLIVEMENQSLFVPCRVIPYLGSGEVRMVGPTASAAPVSSRWVAPTRPFQVAQAANSDPQPEHTPEWKERTGGFP